MNSSQAVEALRWEARHVAWPGEALEQLNGVTRRTGAQNWVTAFELDSSNADEVIHEQIAFFKSHSLSFEWKVFSFDQPDDLLSRLESAGFEVGALEKVVVYEISDGLSPFEGEYPCEVRKVERLEQLGDFRFAAERAFGKDYSFTTDQLADAINSGETGHQGYVAYVGGRPAAIGRLYTHPESAFAGLYGGGTIPEFRGKGCYRAIVAARAKDALAAGCRFLLVDALPTSLPILLRLGFTAVADSWACTFDS